MEKKRNWGTFPNVTKEEVRTEDHFDPTCVQAGLELGHAFIKQNLNINEVLPSLRIRLDDDTTRDNAEAEIYGLVDALIQTTSKARKSEGFRALENSRVFKRISPKTAFSLSIKSVRANDQLAFQAIVGAIKKEHPMHPELAKFRSSDNQTLGHFAALCDHAGILTQISKINPEGLECETSQQDTIAHTASRYCSWKSLDFLVESRPDLFAKRNSSGETPLDLEGGPLIRTMLDIDTAVAAEIDASKNKQTAISILTDASKKQAVAPLIEIKNGKIKSRVKNNDYPEMM